MNVAFKKRKEQTRALLRCSNNNSTYAREIKQQQTRSRLRLRASSPSDEF
jgi:hypothetical protein